MGTKKGKGIKFTRCFKAPFRFLIKARDFYVRSMCDWAARMEKCGSGTGCYAAAQFSIPPDRYSFHSSRNSAQNKELMELMMRANSARNQSNRVDDKSEILRWSPCVKSPVAGGCGARRRGRVGIERIEEDKPCEFGKDVPVETHSG